MGTARMRIGMGITVESVLNVGLQRSVRGGNIKIGEIIFQRSIISYVVLSVKFIVFTIFGIQNVVIYGQVHLDNLDRSFYCIDIHVI